MGESAALGDPEPAFGFSRILRELLEARCPGTKFEVVNVAMTAISSSVISCVARDCAAFHGDIWIIYMGNNEVVGPFGAGSVFGSRSPPSWLIQAGLMVRKTRIGQVLSTVWQHAAADARQPLQWEGMKMMLHDQFRADDSVLQRVYDHFASNLDRILSIAIRSGAKPIVCSVASNLKDCPPFASLNRLGLSEEARVQWSNACASAAQMEARKDYDRALKDYRRASALDNSYSALSFQMARCFLELGDTNSAIEQYTRARDFDALRFRADTQINSIIRTACETHLLDETCFFEAPAMITNVCQAGIPGAECFWDHVHFNFTGNYLVARGLADSVLSRLPAQFKRSFEQGRILTEAECAGRLAYTDWDRRQVLDRMLRRIGEAPFTNQLDHDALVATWSRDLADLDHRLDRNGLDIAVKFYRDALARRPDDWILHYRLSLLLDETGDMAGAEHHLKQVLTLVPGYPEVCFKLGDIDVRNSRLTEAEAYYREVLMSRPSSFEAIHALGVVRMSQGRDDEAIRFFERALRAQPKFAEANVNWGLLLARRGAVAEAEAQYRDALQSDPDSAAAHINLANLLAGQKKYELAIEQYSSAIKLRPREATVRLGFANSLEASGRRAEAIEQFKTAIRLNPDLAEAHFNLAVALAKSGDFSEAARGFAEAVRLKPEDPQAQLNLGVALAKLNRLPEAIPHFEATFRLDPGNTVAKQYLQMAIARTNKSPSSKN